MDEAGRGRAPGRTGSGMGSPVFAGWCGQARSTRELWCLPVTAQIALLEYSLAGLPLGQPIHMTIFSSTGLIDSTGATTSTGPSSLNLIFPGLDSCAGAGAGVDMGVCEIVGSSWRGSWRVWTGSGTHEGAGAGAGVVAGARAFLGSL